MRSFFARVLAPLVCTGILLAPGLASARISDSTTGLGATGQAAGLSTSCSGESATTCIATLLGRVFNILFGFLGVLLLGYILYGGFVWMTAGGDPKAVTQAQDIIRNAIIGLVIIASSFAVSTFVIREVKQISTLGSGTESGGTQTGTGAAGTETPTLDQLSDGALRACCYAGSLATLNCNNDCQANPAGFGLTASTARAQCPTMCVRGVRICDGGPVGSQPTPAPGQATCAPGATTITGSQAQGVGTQQTAPPPLTGSAFVAAFCQQINTNAGLINPATDPCGACVNNDCFGEICADRQPRGMVGAFPYITSQSNADFARQRCQTTVCLTQCASRTLGY